MSSYTHYFSEREYDKARQVHLDGVGGGRKRKIFDSAEDKSSKKSKIGPRTEKFPNSPVVVPPSGNRQQMVDALAQAETDEKKIEVAIQNLDEQLNLADINGIPDFSELVSELAKEFYRKTHEKVTRLDAADVKTPEALAGAFCYALTAWMAN